MKPLTTALRNTKGAIDLASIMVGIIVMGIVGGVIAATVFAVIPWAQDKAAQDRIHEVATAQSAYSGANGQYGNCVELADGGELKNGGSTPQSLYDCTEVVAITTTTDHSCYIAVTRSETGRVFYGGNREGASAKEYVPGTTATVCPAPVPDLTDPDGNGDGENGSGAIVVAFTPNVSGLDVFADGYQVYAVDGRMITNYSYSFTGNSYNFDGEGNQYTGVISMEVPFSVQRTYASAGTYEVTLTVTDDLGRTASHTESFTTTAPEDGTGQGDGGANSVAAKCLVGTDSDSGDLVTVSNRSYVPASGEPPVSGYDCSFAVGDSISYSFTITNRSEYFTSGPLSSVPGAALPNRIECVGASFNGSRLTLTPAGQGGSVANCTIQWTMPAAGHYAGYYPVSAISYTLDGFYTGPNMGFGNRVEQDGQRLGINGAFGGHLQVNVNEVIHVDSFPNGDGVPADHSPEAGGNYHG